VIERRRLRSPWVGWALVMVALAATVTLYAANRGANEDPWFVPLAVTMILSYSTVGAIVASRNPRNPIGWLMLGVGAVFVVVGFCDEYAVYVYVTRAGDDLPGGLLAVWVMNWIFAGMLTFLPLIGLLYPTGTVPSRRWRFVVPVTIAFGALAAVSSILAPTFIADAPVPILNPTGIEGFPADALGGFVWIGLLLMLAASITAVVVRYRRAEGEERQQIRWLAYVVITGVVVLVISIISSSIVGDTFGSTFWGQALAFLGFALVGIGVPVAVGVAILKYRLYDLDIVIKKTVVFAILAVLIAVVLVGTILIATTFATVAAPDEAETGAIAAALFVVGILVWPLWRFSKRIADRLVFGGRSSPYEVLTRFSRRVGDTYSDEDVLPRMAQVLREATRARVARVWLAVGGELRLAASSPNDDDPTRGTVPIRADVVPELGDDHVTEVRHHGELVGALAISMTAADPMNPSKAKLIRDLAGQTGPVLRNVRLLADLRESRRRIVSAQDERARRLERDIHDGAQQQLVALGVKMRLLDQLVERDPAKAQELIEQLQGETTDALENLRDLARGIYPPLLADKGLSAALESQGRKTAIPVHIEPDGIGRYPREIESTVYFCVLEALQNIGKYAEATAVTVRLREADGLLAFEVRDDGIGFDPTVVALGTGLRGMADRLDAIGGELAVESAPGQGTTVRGRIPTTPTGS
jgi:signal transduction histidine kinase